MDKREMLRDFVIVLSIIVAGLLFGCINSSTSFAWKSNIQAPAIEAERDVHLTPTNHDNLIKTDTDIPIDVPLSATK
jgi:hypothetical protein